MKERPILFSAPMVRAILKGRKTQTRRFVKNLEGRPATSWTMHQAAGCADSWSSDSGWAGRCPYGQPGDRLWVRETWRTDKEYDLAKPSMIDSAASVYLLADDCEHRINHRAECGPHEWGKTRVSIHMPRWASRILLEITAVRVERLQDISEADATAEGITALSKDGRTFKHGIPDKDGLPGNDDDGWHWCNWMPDASLAFGQLWKQINGYDSWDENPWVWVIEFKQVTP